MPRRLPLDGRLTDDGVVRLAGSQRSRVRSLGRVAAAGMRTFAAPMAWYREGATGAGEPLCRTVFTLKRARPVVTYLTSKHFGCYMLEHTIMVVQLTSRPRGPVMKGKRSAITPGEIRVIRERLGLSQVQAGELIGGGPSAFAKYEAGAVKPAASVVNLLRVLEANPATIEALRAGTSPVPTWTPSPFEATGQDIAALTERTFPDFLRRLLDAEAETNNLPAPNIHVSSNIHAADGGEDGRISWRGGPSQTPFLRSRLCQFQLKAGGVPPTRAARDVLAKDGTVKNAVRSALEAGGHYAMLCAHAYTPQQVEERSSRIREALRNAGAEIIDDQVDFLDADQIARWANRHPAVAIWVREQTQPGTMDCFRSWSHWAERPEHHGSPWVEDPRLPKLRSELQRLVTEPRRTARVVGLSGVGTSRLVLEALRGNEEGEQGYGLSSLVMYALQSESGTEVVQRTVQRLADARVRAILVVDDCSPETHRVLAGMALREGSRLSLVTIDDDISSLILGTEALRVPEAPPEVTEEIIRQASPGLPSEDQRRLAQFSKGFPGMAIRVCRAWEESIPIADATEDDLVDAFVLGRRPRERDLILKSAALMAAFGLVRVERPPAGHLVFGHPLSHPSLEEIAKLGRSLTSEDLYAAVKQLLHREVAKRRGRLAVLQPSPIAMRLAERQWRESWMEESWDAVLTGDVPPQLKVQAARQLALLNTTTVSQEVVGHVCRIGGPFDGFGGLSKPGHPEVLAALAEIDPQVVVDQIGRSLNDVEDLWVVSGEVRRHLVGALEKIAFHPRTFENAASLLLLLARAENETWDNNATGQFKRLFPLHLGGTAADGNRRLAFLDEVLTSSDSAQLVIAVEALTAGCNVGYFWRVVGAESQGSRPALDPWRPSTSEEAVHYVEGCVRRLAELAVRNDEVGTAARTSLGDALGSLVLQGMLEAVESAIKRVEEGIGYWPEATNSLRMVLAYDAEHISNDAMERVRALVVHLQPKTLQSRIRALVTEMPWFYLEDENHDFQEMSRRQVEVVRELARDLLEQPPVLKEALPELSRGEQRMAYVLGRALADLGDSPLDWLEPITQAAVEAPEGERNYDLLAGLVGGLGKSHPDAVQTFKLKAAQSIELVPVLPGVCSQLGVTPSDVELVVGALQDGLLLPWRVHQWAYGGALAGLPVSAVVPLFDVLLDDGAEAFAAALVLLGAYAIDSPEALDELHPQVLHLAESCTRWNSTRGEPVVQLPMANFYFLQIMTKALEKGRENRNASAIALSLTRALVNGQGYSESRLLEPLLPQLLSGFPEVAWQLIGEAVVSGEGRAFLLSSLLSGKFSFKRTAPPILSLHEDTLFAWCHAYPDRAPAFAAQILPLLTSPLDGAPNRSLHPTVARLVDEFGEREDVRRAIEANIHPFVRSGSVEPYLVRYRGPLNELLGHSKVEVRSWARTVLHQLEAAIDGARNEDEEMEALRDE